MRKERTKYEWRVCVRPGCGTSFPASPHEKRQKRYCGPACMNAPDVIEKRQRRVKKDRPAAIPAIARLRADDAAKVGWYDPAVPIEVVAAKCAVSSRWLYDVFGPRGTKPQGERTGVTKLTADDVRAIRSSSESPYRIAHKYGVTPPAISAVRAGRNWSHVD